MSLFRALLEPRLVALIGACEDQAVAGAVTANLLASRSADNVFLVRSEGSPAPLHNSYASLADVPTTPDLAVICTPADAAADALDQAGRKGIKTAVIITADPHGSAPTTPLKNSLRNISSKHGCRFLGPGSAGMNMPAVGLNSSWIGSRLAPGKLALISQSGSIAASVAGWATSRGIGFSRVISMGDEADIAINEILDVLAADTRTTGLLLHLHSLSNGRAFISSARAIARIKPIMVVKPRGVMNDKQERLVDQDTVYDAVFARAGLLRVSDTEEWFDAAESLSRARTRRNGKIAILSNGNGPAYLAATPAGNEGLLASFQDRTIEILRTLLPDAIAVTNPLILGRDADPGTYGHVLAALQGDANIAAVLVVYSPSPKDVGQAVAQVVAEAAKRSSLTISVCWFGATLDDGTRAALTASKVAFSDLPEKAVRAFIHLNRYHRNQEALRQIPAVRRRQLADATPVSPAPGASPDHALMLTDETESPAFLIAYGMIWRAIKAKRGVLDDAESVAVLRAFGFRVAERPADGSLPLPFSFVVFNDHVFGRVLLVAAAGKRAVALPPLNRQLASELAADAQAALRTAAGIEVSLESIQGNAIRLANLTVELPEVVALDLSVVGVDGDELIFNPARVCVAAPGHASTHLSIHPYPRELEERMHLKKGQEVLVRPIRIEDIRLYHEMLTAIPKEQLFLRFCHQYGDVAQAIPTDLLANLIHFDYSRDMTFIAIAAGSGGEAKALGVVDAFLSPGGLQAEYSILIRSDMTGTGLGKLLMTKIIDYCRSQGVASVFGLVLRNNERMLGLCSRLGFAKAPDDDDDDMVKVVLQL